MKASLLKILVCPACHGPLELRDAERDGEEIVSGLLHCGKCNHSYKIVDRIPNMLLSESL